MDRPPKFRDKRLRQFAEGLRVKDFHAYEKHLDKRLKILEEATCREDLIRLPSNHFEPLLGDRKGQCSIRVNKQWRLCFEWRDDLHAAVNIEVVDYH